MRYALALAALGIFTITLASVSLTSHGTASAAEVSIEAGNLYFCDEAHEGQVCVTNINAGDTVTWAVEAGSHTITQCADNTFPGHCSGGFDSGAKGSGSTFSQTFTTPGTFFYHCEFHPTQMKGEIVAAAQATPTPSATAAVTATPVGGATNSPTSAALPKSGGSPGSEDVAPSVYALLALGAALLAGSGLTWAFVRKRA